MKNVGQLVREEISMQNVGQLVRDEISMENVGQLEDKMPLFKT
jgi:hypothetical protein